MDVKMGGFSLFAPQGKDVCAFYEAASARQKRCVLWDVEMPKRRQALLAEVEAAALAAGAIWQGRPLALAWAKEFCKGSACGHIHFLYCGSARDKEVLPYVAACFIERCFQRFTTLFALVPGVFLGAACLLSSLGFEKRLALPGAILVNGRLRCAAIWTRAREDMVLARAANSRGDFA